MKLKFNKGQGLIDAILILAIIVFAGGILYYSFFRPTEKKSEVTKTSEFPQITNEPTNEPAKKETKTETVQPEKKITPITPIITPTPTPASTPTLTPMTQNKFLLSGTLCTVDYHLLPQSEINARRLLGLCEIDVPKIEAKFGRGPSAPPYKIRFYTPAPGSQGTGGDPGAYVDGGTVVLSTAKWYIEFPNDAVILAHELTHVIQSFSGYNTPEYPGWLVEALADYGAHVAGYSNDLEKSCYHFLNSRQINVFKCTYNFLKFVERKYDPQVSFKLHKALQSGTYSDNLFVQYTGKNYDQLISECSQDLECAGIDLAG